MEETLTRVLGYLRANCLPNARSVDLDADVPLLQTNLIDSIHVLEMIGFLQEEFGVSIAVEDVTIDNFGTPRAVAALVERLRLGSPRYSLD